LVQCALSHQVPWSPSLSHPSSVFSQWLGKEISMAKNIKDRTNRQNVQRILTVIQQRLVGSGFDYNQLGIFCFVGINEFSDEIVEFIEPDNKIVQFYYSCANKFHIEPTEKYIGTNVSGVLVFANGNECLCYQFMRGQFVKLFGINGNLTKSHKKGGYSANRFARLAEESRHAYIVRIADRLKDLDNLPGLSEKIWIFGSEEIVQMFLTYWTQQMSHVKISHGGFLNFNSNTIANNQYWIDFLSKPSDMAHDIYYKEISQTLNVNPDLLDFDPANKANPNIRFFIEKTPRENSLPNQIPFPTSKSQFYNQLGLFEYVGIKYFSYIEPDAELND